MIDSYYPTTEQFLESKRTRRNLLVAGLLATILFIFGAITGLAYIFPRMSAATLALVGFSALGCLIVPVVIWNNPRQGLNMLVVGALLFPAVAGDGRITIPTTYVPMWWNISSIGQYYGNTGAANALVFSPAEAIMGMAALAWLLRGISMRTLKLHQGAFFVGIAAYSAMVALGFIHGIVTGGNSTMALYEVRAQAHFFLMYLMAANLITERRHAMTVLWLVVGCIGLQSLFGTLTYFSLGGNVTDQGILSHDDSLIFNLLFFILFLAVMARLDKKLLWAVALLTPSTLLTVLANNRRAGIAAFIVAFLPLLPLLWRIYPERRKQIGKFALFFALFNAVYIPVAWNAQGIWALPARAIKSQSEPSERDASSDFYRMAENGNLKYTRDTQPWTGIGYGKAFIEIVPLPKLTTDFLQYIPHNSVLWIWMCIGHTGFFAFLMMYAVILIRGGQLLREMRDPALKAVAILGMLDMLMMFAYGKFDLQFANTRQMVVAGILVGTLIAAHRIDRERQAEAGTEIEPDATEESPETTRALRDRANGLFLSQD